MIEPCETLPPVPQWWWDYGLSRALGNMTLNPESPEEGIILRSYAEGCWARFVKSPGYGCNPEWAIQNRDKWIANCMSDAKKSIATGLETWKRLEALYRQNGKTKG